MFDRETRLEKIIEAKHREHKTKLQTKLPEKVDDLPAKAKVAIEEIERELAEVVDRMVSCCDFIFFKNQSREIRIYVLMAILV